MIKREYPADSRPPLKRSNTTATKVGSLNTKGGSKKWPIGYSWGIGKKDKETHQQESAGAMYDRSHNSSQESGPPVYSARGSLTSGQEHGDYYSPDSEGLSYTDRGYNDRGYTDRGYTDRGGAQPTRSNTMKSNVTQSSTNSKQSKVSIDSKFTGRLTSESASTLVGSALQRKIDDVDPRSQPRIDTTERLEALRDLMATNNLEY